MAKVVVTGAAGFIGSHVVDRLLAEGHQVLGLDNLRTGKLANLALAEGNPAFRFEKIDVAIPGALDSRLRSFGADACVHLAALVSVAESVADPAANFGLNVALSHVAAEAVRTAGTPRLVFASSAAVYGDPETLPLMEDAPTQPQSPYAAAKLASEAILFGHGRCYGFEVVALRFFNVYGTRQDPRSPYSGVLSIFAERMAAGQTITVFGDGKQTRDFVAVEDVARAVVAAATRSPSPASGAYNVCTGVSTSLLDLLALLREAFPGAPEPVFAPARAGDIRHSLGDPSRMLHALDFAPLRPVGVGLPAWLASRG